MQEEYSHIRLYLFGFLTFWHWDMARAFIAQRNNDISSRTIPPQRIEHLVFTVSLN